MRASARLLAAMALLGFSLWLVGAVLGDRAVWSQWLSWIPTVATLVGMVVCVAGSWVCARLTALLVPGVSTSGAGGTAAGSGARARRAGSGSRRLAGALALGLGAFMLVGEWRIQRLVFKPAAPSGRAFTLLYWNHASNWSLSWMDTTSRELSDITVLNAPLYWERMPELMAKIGKEHTEKYQYQRVDSYAVISRWPIARWARINLNLPTVQTKLRPYATVWERGWYWNRGGAAWIEFDTKASLGKNLVVWIMDMPSDPRLHREEICRIASETMRGWNGGAMERGPVGQFIESKQKMEGFPAPDMIFGDFNIPRGARSLRHLVGGATGAFEAVGVGSGATYPARLPLFGIDQMFTRGDVSAASYRLFHPGFGTHKAQHATLVVREAPGS
jgi:endonuclease/exonuclease/phosphatase family metal-dependent hydrolase